MFDITLFPLFLAAGREQYELPGLYATAAPRKAARIRAQDMLVLFWRLTTPSGAPSAALTRAQQQEILTKLSETYFVTPGSVTAGLRAVVTRLNDFLLNRNLRPGSEGQLVGTLNLASLRGESLIVAHAGPAHSFVLGKGQVQYFDDSGSPREGAGGRGLGLARQVMPRFYQVLMQPGDLLVLCSDPPDSWTPRSLAGSPQLTLDHLRRRLLSEAVNDLQAAVIRVQAGKGQVTYWKPSDRPTAGERSAPTERAASSERRPAPASEPPVVSPTAVPPVTDQGTAYAASPQVEKAIPARPLVSETPPGPTPLAAGPLMKETEFPANPARPEPISPEPSVEPVAKPADTLPADIAPGESSPANRQPAEETQPAGALKADDAAANGGAAQVVPAATNTPIPPGEGVFIGEAASRSGAKAAAEPASRPVPRPAQRSNETTEGSSAPSVGQPNRPAGAKPGSALKKGPFAWLNISNRARAAGKTKAAGMASSAARSENAGRDRGASGVAKPSTPAPLATPRSERLRRWLITVFHGGRSAKSKVEGALATTAAKVAPGQTFGGLPQAWLLLIAIAVPLAVVAAATTVYVRAGRSEQFNLLFGQARQYADQAVKLSDPLQQKEAWTRAFDLSNQALTRYDHTNQPARELRQQALNQLDAMDSIVRLDYQPLRDGLGPDVKITKMVSTLTGVYMLDSNQGRIYRLQPVTTGYSIDPQFSCGPGKAGSSIITNLIDLAPLPINNELRADILAIDAGGNLVYCSSNLAGFDSKVLPPPDSGWGKITAITTLGDALFVLDPSGNAVYRYDGENGMYSTSPHLYFDNDIPRMADVIDLDVDPEFLYMLHANGEMTVCNSSGVSFAPVKCSDPAPYGDSRLGFDPAPLTFPAAHFNSIQTTQPPAASLYALDDANRAIYHLSLRKLNLQRQFRPQVDTDFPLPSTPATGFVITLNRRAILAFGNQVFFAQTP